MFLSSEYCLDGIKDVLAGDGRLLVAALHREEVPRTVLQRDWRSVSVGGEDPGLNKNRVAALCPGEVRTARVGHQVVDAARTKDPRLGQYVLLSLLQVVVVQVRSEDVRADVVPDAVDVLERVQAHVLSFLLKNVFPVPVGNLAGLPYQRRVNKVTASQLLVKIFYTEQKGAVTKSRLKEEQSHQHSQINQGENQPWAPQPSTVSPCCKRVLVDGVAGWWREPQMGARPSSAHPEVAAAIFNQQ